MCSTSPAYKIRMECRPFFRCRSYSGRVLPAKRNRPFPSGKRAVSLPDGPPHGWPSSSQPAFFFCMLRTGSFSLWKDALEPLQNPRPSGENPAEILTVIQPLRLHPLGIKLFFLLISQIFRNIKTKRDHIQPSLFGRHPFTQFRTDALSFLFSDFIINFYGLSANHLII